MMNRLLDATENTQSLQDVHAAVIKVIGVGGGGGNALAHMIAQKIEGVHFICANTDAQAMKNIQADVVIQLGEQITHGKGVGANPDLGRQAAEVDRERIRGSLEGADMVFITAGMGGGTGTGAAPIVAEIAKQLGILTVAVVTKPFTQEGKRRMDVAEQGIKQLEQHVDSLITIPNYKLMEVLGKQVSFLDALKASNDVLLRAVQGIVELITRPGLINVDFADVCAVMSEMGMAMMGTGIATGADRAKKAAKNAIDNPLLEDINLAGAQGVLVNITAGLDLSIGEFEEVGEVIKEFASEGANIILGTVIDPDMDDALRVTVVLTGLGKSQTRDGGSTKTTAMPFTRASSTQAQDYRQFDRPAILRKQSSGLQSDSEHKPTLHPEDYLDIPTFLRRQKDGIKRD